MEDSAAKIYSDQRNVTTYVSDSGRGFKLPFRENWRPADAAAAVIGFIATAGATTAAVTSQSGDARTILLVGVCATAAAVWLLAKLPKTRPGARTRLRWWSTNLRPRLHSTHPDTDIP